MSDMATKAPRRRGNAIKHEVRHGKQLTLVRQTCLFGDTAAAAKE
jgi:hypothetical protein